MKALVTGGAGFIGSTIVRQLLDAGHQVVVLDNLSSGYRGNLVRGIEFIESDVRDPHAVIRASRNVEVLFHLAASVGNARGIESPSNDASINILGTLNVLEAARASGCRKVVYSSSAAIFGEPRLLPISDDHPFAPATPYGVSKLSGELYARAYAALHAVETVALRYFNVYGEGQRFDAYGNVVPIFATRMLRGESITIFGDGHQTRDFVNVADVAQANLLAALPGVAGAYNVGSGKAVAIRALADMMIRLVGRDIPIEHSPPRSGDVLHSQADITGLHRAAGYAPACELENGLRQYFAWMERTATESVT